MINALDLTAGTRVTLHDGRTATVVENMKDGMWVEAREDGTDGGELIHVQEIARIAEA
jgi:hypothetical protein